MSSDYLSNAGWRQVEDDEGRLRWSQPRDDEGNRIGSSREDLEATYENDQMLRGNFENFNPEMMRMLHGAAGYVAPASASSWGMGGGHGALQSLDDFYQGVRSMDKITPEMRASRAAFDTKYPGHYQLSPDQVMFQNGQIGLVGAGPSVGQYVERPGEVRYDPEYGYITTVGNDAVAGQKGGNRDFWKAASIMAAIATMGASAAAAGGAGAAGASGAAGAGAGAAGAAGAAAAGAGTLGSAWAGLGAIGQGAVMGGASGLIGGGGLKGTLTGALMGAAGGGVSEAMAGLGSGGSFGGDFANTAALAEGGIGAAAPWGVNPVDGGINAGGLDGILSDASVSGITPGTYGAETAPWAGGATQPPAPVVEAGRQAGLIDMLRLGGLSQVAGPAAGLGRVLLGEGKVGDYFGLLGPAMSIGSGISGMFQGGKLQDRAAETARVANPWGTSGGQSLAMQQLMQLMQNPGSLMNDPGYRARMMGVERQNAKYGAGSGNMAVAAANASGDYYGQRMAQLGQLAGAPGNPAGAAQLGFTGYQAGNAMSNAGLTEIGYGVTRATGGNTALPPAVRQYLLSQGMVA